jgi:hypothetical protein
MCTVNTEHNSSRQKIIDHYFFSFVHASFGGPLDEVVPGFSAVPAKVPAAGSIEQNGKTSNKLNWICSLVANRRQIFAQNMHTILFQENTRYSLQSGRNASISFSTEQTVLSRWPNLWRSTEQTLLSLRPKLSQQHTVLSRGNSAGFANSCR